MKSILSVLLLFFTTLSFANSSDISYEQKLEDFESRFTSFNKEISKTLDLRLRAIDFYGHVSGKDYVLTSKDLRLIHGAAKKYASNRQNLLSHVEDAKWFSNWEIELDLVLEEKNKLFGWMFGSKKTVDINPTTIEGQLQILEMKKSLTAALMLYDNYILAIAPYDKNKKLRRTLNFDNIELDDLIQEISGNFRVLENYKRTLRAVEFIEKVIAWEKDNKFSWLSQNSYNHYMNELIEGSYTYLRIGKITVGDRISYRLKRFATMLKDEISNVGNETMNLVSMGFGNSVGLIQTRSGKMKDIALNEEKEIRSQMKPLDIIFEKTPFRLTDKFIPGHWGHVAIWVGTEDELKELGIWEELDELYETVKRDNGYEGQSFKKAVRSGHNVVEALRPGVQLNSLRHFLDIDDLAVTRTAEEMSLEMKRHYLRKAFLQVGKDYDFNFDVQTDKKIVCSELAYVVYEDYQWPVEESVGRYTISPDHVAVKAKSDDGIMKPILIYHDGKKITSSLQENFDKLLELKYDQIKF